jgi:23S rRNA (guanosine2251-2'-O)-methyltransferase
VRELLAARQRAVRDVWIAEGGDPAPILAEIESLAIDARVPVRRVARARLVSEAHTEAPQGVLAHAEPLREADVDELFVAGPRRRPFLLAVDGVTDPQNLGALLRSAEAAGVSGVLLPRHRAVHVTATVAKAAAGAIEWVPMAIVPGLPAALAAAGRAGLWVVGLDERGPTSLFDLELATEPVVVVLGAEGTGLGRLVRERCDVVASIPAAGHLGSLNVAAAGALALFEVARRRSN